MHERVDLLGGLGGIEGQIVGHGSGVGGAERTDKTEADADLAGIGLVRRKLQIPADRGGDRSSLCQLALDDGRGSGMGRLDESCLGCDERAAGGAAIEVDVGWCRSGRNIDGLVGDGDRAGPDFQRIGRRSLCAVAVTNLDRESVTATGIGGQRTGQLTG
ncbi:hypothetical protein D3C87_1683320 [compost metagenome]